MANLTGMIFNDAFVRVSTATCWNITATTGMYDISGAVQQVRISLDSDVRDNTTMGMSYRSQLRALKTATIELRALNSFAIATTAQTLYVEATSTDLPSSGMRSPDSLFMDLYDSENRFILAVRPDNAVRSSCNPDYWVPCVLGTHTPLDGSVADLLVTGLRFQSQGELTRSVSSSS